MDHKTVECAFRLSTLLQSKHQFTRVLDTNTRLQVALIVQSAVQPPSLPSLDTYTKGDFTNDLEYFARAVIDQALRSQVTLVDIKKTVKEAMKETAPPLPLSLEDIRSSTREVAKETPVPPTLEEIRSTVQSTVDKALAPDMDDFTSADEVCPGCHSLNRNCARWKASRPTHEQYRYY
jgi:hypothetical protein